MHHKLIPLSTVKPEIDKLLGYSVEKQIGVLRAKDQALLAGLKGKLSTLGFSQEELAFEDQCNQNHLPSSEMKCIPPSKLNSALSGVTSFSMFNSATINNLRSLAGKYAKRESISRDQVLSAIEVQHRPLFFQPQNLHTKSNTTETVIASLGRLFQA